MENKVALVTGGGRGIGRAIVLALAKAGWQVAFSYRGNAEAAQATLAEIQAAGAEGLAVQADVSFDRRSGQIDRRGAGAVWRDRFAGQ